MGRRNFTLPSSIVPRPYQVDAAHAMQQLVTRQPETWHLFSSPTGTGKSIIELMYLSQNPDSIMITPRVEIISGMLDKMGEKTDGLDDMKLTRLAWDRYGIITPIRLRNMLAKGELDFMPHSLLIDECFPAGTMVDTPFGPEPIEHIQTGNKVLTYDESSGTIKVGTVGKVYINPLPAIMVRIQVDGRLIECTSNHPILTSRGWVPAGALYNDDEVCVLQWRDYEPNETPAGQGTQVATELLSPFVHGKCYESRTIYADGADEPQARIRADESTQPNVKPVDSIKDEEHPSNDWTQTANQERERDRLNRMRAIDSGCNEVEAVDSANQENARSTLRVEGGFGQYVSTVSSGDRRQFTRHAVSEGTGRTEIAIPTFVRLDSVEVYEYRSERGTGESDSGNYVYNFEVEGTHTYLANGIIVHNCHHDSAQTYQDITMYLNGCPKVGLTATPYRGTPKQTREFHRQWGDTVNQILSLSDAVEQGFYQIPECEIWPLLDDDTIDVSAGDFRVTTCEAKLADSYGLLVSNCRKYYNTTERLWDMPTLFSLPGSKSVEALASAFRKAGMPVVTVTQATSRLDRIKAFDATVNCVCALLQINVVSEGVDLPIRRVIDCSPTMSPVRWFQQVGRIRPSKSADSVPPEYICCCRNLERHCYLFEGLLPNTTIQEAQSAFTDDEGKPVFSKRSGTRVVGLEGLGRFVTTPVHLLNGTIGFMYNLVSVEGNKRTEFIAFVHPNNQDPVYGIKQSANDGTEMKWGKWRLIESIPDVKGCVSAKVNPLSEKQESRWYSSAEAFGLDPHRQVDTREFQILPFLMNTGLSFRT